MRIFDYNLSLAYESGVPLHDPVEGSLARGAAVSLAHAAVVDPASPRSVIVPVSGAILRVGNGGKMSVLAGRGTDASSYSVLASNAQLIGSTLVAIGPRGVIIADEVAIRTLDKTGRLSVIAGNLSFSGPTIGVGLPALGTPIARPECLHCDATTGDIYFCEGDTVVRVIRASGPDAGLLVTVAGNGSALSSIDGALATATGFSDIRDVHTAPNGDLVIAENDHYFNPRIIRVSAIDGRARTVVGSALVSSTGSVTNDLDSAYFLQGAPANSPLTGAISVYVEKTTGALYFSDNTRIGRLTSGGTLDIVAGLLPSQSAPVIDGGPPSYTTLFLITGLRVGSGPGEIIVVDTGAEVVYRLDLVAQRVVAVLGPVQLHPLTPELTRGSSSSLLATDIPLPAPYDVTYDPNTGDVYSALASGDVIVKVSARDGTMSVIAGTGYPGCAGDNVADATLAELIHPTSISLDGYGHLIIADRRCCLLRRLDLSTGFLKVIAGSVAKLCDNPYTVDADVSPGTLQVATPTVHEHYYTIVDQATGDIYWTEDLSHRVLVMRANGGRAAFVGPFRVAGNGETGIDYDGVVAPGAVALNTALAVPSSITLEPSTHAVVFIDGYAPGRILRIARSGVLEVIASISQSRSLGRALIDGPLPNATAYSLAGLSFSADGSSLLVSDTPQTSFVRRISIVGGVGTSISRVAGVPYGDASDGGPLLQTVFAFISSLTVLPGGTILVADAGSNILRVGISEGVNFVRINCVYGGIRMGPLRCVMHNSRIGEKLLFPSLYLHFP